MKTAIMFILIGLCAISTANGQYCDPPGELAGVTGYYSQGYGASAQRIAQDTSGGIHIAWTGASTYPPRHIYYNYRDNNGTWSFPGTGSQVNQVGGAGFASLALLSGGEAAVAYHNLSNNYAQLAIDGFPGFGIFSFYDVPELLPNGSHGFWPQVAISANGDLHVLITEHSMGGDGYQLLAYTRSEDNGATWTSPVVIDSVTSQVSTITTSSSGKVAIVYLKPTDMVETSVVKNDVCYFESVDGRTWDFGNPTNITDYLNDSRDIFCPWGQDAVYGVWDNLNIVWVTNNIAMDGSFIDDATGLCHYSSYTGSITVVSEMTDTLLNCDPGPMNSAIAMPTVSARRHLGLGVAITYTGFVDSDVSADGYCVGDLYLVLSNPDLNWYNDVGNVTETHTPNCLGDCESEEFPSLTEAMYDSSYLTYVMRNYGDEPDTVYYMPFDLPFLTGTEDNKSIPIEFALFSNYPNPFNARTTIEFMLGAQSDVELTIYDITGAKVMALERSLDARQHSIVWDAGDAASGIYFARLEAGGYSSSIKMVLLK